DRGDPEEAPSVMCARSDWRTLAMGVDGASWMRSDPDDVATVTTSPSTLSMVPRMCSAFVAAEALPPYAWSKSAAQSSPKLEEVAPDGSDHALDTSPLRHSFEVRDGALGRPVVAQCDRALVRGHRNEASAAPGAAAFPMNAEAAAPQALLEANRTPRGEVLLAIAGAIEPVPRPRIVGRQSDHARISHAAHGLEAGALQLHS